MTEQRSEHTNQLSVVVPSYNSADWLPTTLRALSEALEHAEMDAEVLLIDDGSTDRSESVVGLLTLGSRIELRYIKQSNQGRYRARLAGLKLAKNDAVLFLDSRVVLDRNSLSAVKERISYVEEGKFAINGHTRLPENTPLVGRFWDVPTHIFWADYLRKPREYELTPENFDRAPKGFTFFLAGKTAMLSAFDVIGEEESQEFVSDDTRILRALVNAAPIMLLPSFSGVYRPRTSFTAFLKHSQMRGTLFIDSYAGTTAARTLALGFAAVLPFIIVGLSLWAIAQSAWMFFLILGLLLVGSPLGVSALALTRRAGLKSAAAFVMYFYPFAIVFWLGLVRGVIVHRNKIFSSQDRDG